MRNFLKNSTVILAQKQKNILSAAFILMLAVLFSRILGLVRDRLLAGRFFVSGNQWQLDVYFAAFRIPDMLFQLLVLGAMSAAFIPVFSSYLRKSQSEAYEIASSVINLGVIVFLLLASLAFFLAKPLSSLITGFRFNGRELLLMVNLLRILLVSQLFFILSSLMTGILQSNQRFLLPAISAIIYNLGIIFGIVILAPILGIYGPTLGVIIGAFLHFIIQLPLVLNLGFKYQFNIDFRHPGVRRIGKLMLPRTLSLAVSQLELNVAVFIATSLAAGSLSIYNFAQHLNALPVGLFGATVGQAALPIFSKMFGDKKTLKDLIIASLHNVLYLALPASAILLVLRIPLVRIAFGTKGFPWEATILTGWVVAVFSLSIFAQSITEILVRAFYALQDTKTPLFLTAFVVLADVTLSFIFTFNLGWGLLGLAAAASFTSILYALLLLVFLDKKIGGFSFRQLFGLPAKMILATFLTGIALWVPLRFLDRFVFDTTRTINLIILTIVTCLSGLTVYLLFSKLFKIPQLNIFLRIIKNFGAWRQILAKSEEVIDSSARHVTSIVTDD